MNDTVLDPALSVIFFLLCFACLSVLGCHARGKKEVRSGLFFHSFFIYLGEGVLGVGVGVRDIFLGYRTRRLLEVKGTGTLGSTGLEYSYMMRREVEWEMSWLVAFRGSLHGGGCMALSWTST